MKKLIQNHYAIGKPWALGCKVMWNFRLHLETGRRSVKPKLKHWILM